MNVLPVIVDLSPPPKLDLSSQGLGSSVGDFTRILDQALSGPSATGGTTRSPFREANTPYVSPTRQSPEPPPEQQRTSSSDQQASQADASTYAASRSAAQGDRSTTTRHGREASANPDSSSSNSEARRSHETGHSAAGKSSKTPKDGQANGTHAAKEKSSIAADAARSTAKKGKRQRADAKTSSGVLFPGALVLNGAHKTAGNTGKQAASKSSKLLEVAKNLLKGTDTTKNAKLTASGKPGSEKKPVDAKAKGHTADTKELVGKEAVQSQLVATPLATANNPAAPQTMGAHSAPETSVNQQEPGSSGSQNGTANQAAGVTIIDLRKHDQNGSSTAGQDGGRGQSNNGTNARLFQLADGGAAGSMKMSGQAGMARAAGAPSQGPAFSAFTDQIVKQTGILLKNNNSGEIRLLLKPENLGNLRIKLDLSNNNLSGNIFVQNHEALKLVQQNLDSLYRALRESGFTATELNVSVGGRDNGDRNKQRSSPLPSMRLIEGVRGFDNQPPALETAGSYYSLINLVI